MRKIYKQVIALLLVLLLSLPLCACTQKLRTAAESDGSKTTNGTDTLSRQNQLEEISEKSDTQEEKQNEKPVDRPAQTSFSEEAQQSLDWLREGMSFPEVMFGTAYLGSLIVAPEDDLTASVREYVAKNAMQWAYPFLHEIEADRIGSSIDGDQGDLFCIVPMDKNATVEINRVIWNTRDGTNHVIENIYQSDSGDPVLLFVTWNDDAFVGDVQILLTDSAGNSCEWYPLFDDDTYRLVPCATETGENVMFDFTEYGWLSAPGELAPWLGTGYNGVTVIGLGGCWTTQAETWDTNQRANYYLWFFPEDETGGSIDLDWQYEGSDLFEEMWSGFWTITSVIDGPSYVTITLSLVGGENYGVVDGPYYISETYPIMISPSGEEMVIGVGMNGISLPFMSKYDSQLCTLTLDSRLTQKSVD